MIDLLVLTQRPKTYSTQRLLEEAKLLKLRAQCCNPFLEGLNPTLLKKYNAKLAIHRITGVNFDDFDLTFAKLLQIQGVRVFNEPYFLEKIRDKEKQWLFFQAKNIPHIPSFVFRGPPREDFFDFLQDYFYPHLENQEYILKTIRGNRGIGTNLIIGNESLMSILETFFAMRDQKFILQPRIKFDSELRIFMVKGKILGAIERKRSKSSFRGNLGRNTQKATFVPVDEFPKKLKDLCNKVLFETSPGLMALDIIKENENYLLLEINPVPGFEAFEKISGINVAQKILIGLHT